LNILAPPFDKGDMETTMPSLPPEAAVIEKLVAWGQARTTVRAMILESSRARPAGRVDLLSDYDVILAVTDADAFRRNDAWLHDYGPSMVRWGDQSALYGLTTDFYGVIYEDGVKIDYTVWPDALLARFAAPAALPDDLDLGYRVLLDKDGRTAGWPPPTYRAYIPARPTEAEYRALIEEFWWSATYVAKSLWRDEFFFARWLLEDEIKNGTLRRLLEWRIEIDHGWSVTPGVHGRGLERRLPADLWSELASTYVGPDLEENWTALFRTTALMRRVAQEVGHALGYVYPQQVDDRVSAYLSAVRELAPDDPPVDSE
jgi:aminoglycoside 6-adenylyltransferase